MPKALVIGAGAVGQVFGRHLSTGGCAVSYFCKPKYEQTCRKGFTLYPLHNKKLAKEGVKSSPTNIISQIDSLTEQHWDQVWICVSSTALRSGWLDDFAALVGEASLVTLTPGIDDYAYVCKRFPKEQVVQGVITFLAYQAPLANESFQKPGIAYWFPPLSARPFSGDSVRVNQIVKCLNQGGCQAKAVRDAPFVAASGAALMDPIMVALEIEGWSFQNLRKSSTLKTACRAARQAVAIVAHHHKKPVPFHRHFVRPWGISMMSRMSKHLVPLDLEPVLKFHYQKVGDQTRFLLQELIGHGKEANLQTEAIEQLLDNLSSLKPSS